MLGAILICGLVAVTSSAFATLCNFVLARKYPEFGYGSGAELPEALFLRITWYRLVAKVFYLQALFFWLFVAALLLIHVWIS